MSIDLADYDQKARDAVQTFWKTRLASSTRVGAADTGARSLVTGGKNMDGFQHLVHDVVIANGLPSSSVFAGTQAAAAQRRTVLPGHYRPVKDWDVIVVHDGELVAAVELKSQVGSLGNNFNNRAEEAIGMGEDLRVAYREGRLGRSARPFVGYLMLVEDSTASTTPVSTNARHFGIDPVFQNASYAERYDELCRRLTREGLYAAAALLLSPPTGGLSGDFRSLADDTSLRAFIAALAARVAQAVAR